jgi:hypothetical protein
MREVAKIVPDRIRTVLSLSLVGMMALSSGCGGSGDAGESTVAQGTPPPGASGAEIAAAIKAARGPTGVPKQAKHKPAFKAR